MSGAPSEVGVGVRLTRAAAPFAAVVSPYHLTTREPAAMVTLQLAEHAVTLLLSPAGPDTGSPEEVAAALEEARRSVAYERYMSSWEWAEGLFREGLLGSVEGGEDPVDDVRRACARLGSDASLAELARYARADLFVDERAYLRLAAIDVLKGGPDPGVSIPVAAGLDAFAAAHGLVVARSSAQSLAQKAEARLGREVFRVVVPTVLQGSADRVLLVRALLDGERTRLGREVSRAFIEGDDGGVRDAAASYAEAFQRERGEICSPPARGEEDEVRVIVGETSLVGMELPADAVLRSSVHAVGGRFAGVADDGAVRALIVRPLGRR